MNETSHTLPQRSLDDYLSILRRRKWVVIESVLIVAIVTGVLSTQQQKVFKATAAMLVNRQDLGAAVTGLPNSDATADPARNVQTQATLARVPAVAQQAVTAAGVPGVTTGTLLLDSSVIGSPDSDFLTFVVKNGDAVAAQKLATAYAHAYASYRLNLDTSTLKTARIELERRAAALAQSGDRSSVLYRDLVQKAEQLRTTQLLQQRNEVVKDASRGTQIAPTPKRNALLGAMIGLVLGLGIAAIWEALDKRVRSEEEIEDTLGLPLLARLPEPPKEISAESRLVMLEEPTGVHAEAVRRLRTNVEFAMLEGDAQTIMITSAVQREGKSTTVANLALALARSGRKVALIDLDLRQPMVDQFFALQGAPGVTDVALGRASLDEVLVEVSVPERSPVTHIASAGKALPLLDGKLSVIPSGQLPASPGEFVGTVAMAKLLADLRRSFDIVLIDAPPMCIVGDAMTLSTKIDAFIVVARLGTLERRTLADLQREIAASPARALGVVVTGVDPTDTYGMGSYYHKPAERSTSRSRAERPAEANSERASARPR
jgi:capsular exopolysaccharide synthesis family protein